MLYPGECRVQAEVAAGSGAEHDEGRCVDQRQEEPEQARLARVRFEVIHGEVDFIDRARPKMFASPKKMPGLAMPTWVSALQSSPFAKLSWVQWGTLLGSPTTPAGSLVTTFSASPQEQFS